MCYQHMSVAKRYKGTATHAFLCFYRVMAQPGDVPVEEYTAEEYENDAEYEVDSIVAEKKIGRITVYLVKWKVCLLKLRCS